MTTFLTALRALSHRLRQHHAIEHATLYMLAERFPTRTFAGYSDPRGFTIYGPVDEPVLRRAVGEALLRLQGGQSQLALHPNCGTNFATGVVLTTIGAWVGLSGRRGLLDRLGATLLLVAFAQLAAKPLGMYLQAYTTTPDVADRWLAEIRPVQIGKQTVHRVIFE